MGSGSPSDEREEISREIVQMRQRLDQLRQRPGGGIIPGHTDDETFEELQTSLEELQQTNDELHATRDMLLREHERYVDLFENAPDAYFVTDLDGIIRQANRAASTMLNVSALELRGKPIAIYIPLADRRAFRTHLEDLRANHDGHEWETQFEARGRGPIAVALTAQTETDNVGTVDGLRWLVRDISERRRTERTRAQFIQENIARVEAERQRDFIRKLVDNAPLAILVVEGEEHRFTIVNSLATTLIGIPADRMGGLSLNETQEAVYQTLVPIVQRVLQTGQTERVENLSLPLGGGRTIHVDATFTPIATADESALSIMCMAVDVTQRRLAEEALQNERDRLQQLINVLPEALIIADNTGRVAATNAASRDILGLELTGTTLPLRGDPAYNERRLDGSLFPAAELPLQRAISRGETVRGEQMLVSNAITGLDVPLLSNSAPLRDSNGQISGGVVVFQDISAIRELHRLRDEWASIIAHDLRQPMTIIRGYISLLRRNFGERPELAREYRVLEHVSAAVDSLTTLIEDLRDASLIEINHLTLDLNQIDLAELVRSVVERQTTIAADRVIHLDLPRPVAPVDADASRVEQILGNLLTNASKYGFPSTPTHVRVEQLDNEVEIVVANQGPGIPAEDIPKIFSRFYRARETKEKRIHGLGLGLYITRGLVEAHGGRIWVESVPDQTTAFHVIVPQMRRV